MEENLEKGKNKQAELEALLFYYGEAISVKKIAKIIGVKEEEVRQLLDLLEAALKGNPERGLQLIRNEDEIQLATKPEFQSIGQQLTQDEFKEELTPASLETLSIVAYLGPITRMMIDYIRGVNSSFTLRSLLIRGLVERDFQPDKANVYEYRASFDFLKHLGLGRREDLPEYEKYKDILSKFEMKPEMPATSPAPAEVQLSVDDQATVEPQVQSESAQP
jgi:segregation and condensation protein B